MPDSCVFRAELEVHETLHAPAGDKPVVNTWAVKLNQQQKSGEQSPPQCSQQTTSIHFANTMRPVLLQLVIGNYVNYHILFSKFDPKTKSRWLNRENGGEVTQWH